MIRPVGLALFFLFTTSHGQDIFQCGNQDDAHNLEFTDFNTIEMEGNWKKKDGYLLPRDLYWHIYAITSGETPKYSTYPDGLLEPKLSGSKLYFSGTNVVEELGYKKGDRIEASVNLFIPIDKMANLIASGVDQAFEVIADDASLLQDGEDSVISIQDSGVDNKWYVIAPYSKVHYKGSGVDNSMYLEAASGSSVDVSGVDQKVIVKSEFLTKVKLSGVDQKVWIEGDYEKIDLKGVDTSAYVNGESGCDRVNKDGVDNKCNLWAGNATVPELNCLVSTKVVKGNNDCWNLSTMAAVGVAFGSAALLISICVCCCFCWKACCCRRKKAVYDPSIDKYMKNTTAFQPHQTTSQQTPGFVQAEVIEVKPTSHVGLPSTYEHDVEAGTVQAEVIEMKSSCHVDLPSTDGHDVEVKKNTAPVQAKVF